MEFNDKYISETENAEKPDEKKITISNEAFAIGEMLEKILRTLRRK